MPMRLAAWLPLVRWALPISAPLSTFVSKLSYALVLNAEAELGAY